MCTRYTYFSSIKGSACRLRASVQLAEKYPSPADADKHYAGVSSSTVATNPPPVSTLATLLSGTNPPAISSPSTPPNLDPTQIVQYQNPFACDSDDSVEIVSIDTLSKLTDRIRAMLEGIDVDSRVKVLSSLYCKIAEESRVFVPDDYLQFSLYATKQLENSGSCMGRQRDWVLLEIMAMIQFSLQKRLSVGYLSIV